MSIVANNIKYLRKLNGYTQEQFAQRIGIKRSLLGAYEEARANPNQVYLDNMSREFGVPVENMLRDDLREKRRSQDTGTIVRLNPEPKPVQNFSSKEHTMPALSGGHPAERFPAPAGTHAPVTGAAVPVPDNAQTGGAARGGQPEKELPLRELALAALQHTMPDRYRTFEAGDDSPTPGALLIGTRCSDPYTLKDNVHYVLVTREHGSLYRRVFNQMFVKGTLLLSSDTRGVPTLELPGSDILEAWEIKACLSTSLPVPTPTDRLRSLVQEMHHLLGT